MKNKLIINIILVYFVLLAVVLVVQMRMGGNANVATEPLRESVRYSDILSEGVVLYDRSPVMLVRQKQRLVSDERSACVPVIEGDSAMVPIDFFEQAYGAVVSHDKAEQTATIRLNNKALVVDGKKDAVTLVSASGERELKAKGTVEFKNGTVYIPLTGFAEGFEKSLSLYENMALLSDSEPKLKKDDAAGFIAEVKPQVYNLPSVGEAEKLEELLGSGAVNIFNTIGRTISLPQKKSPVNTLGLDSYNAGAPTQLKADEKYIYFVNKADNSINIATTGKDTKVICKTTPDLSEIYGIYVSGNYLSVIGSGKALTNAESSFEGCTVLVYDITDKMSPKIVRQIGAEGNYSTAYKKDDTLYLFVKKEAESADSFGMPNYYDSANASVGETESLSDVRYVPEMADKAYTSVICFNITDMAKAVNVYTLLGCGDNYSLTGDSLYIAVPSGNGSSVYKLALNGGGISYAAAAYTDGIISDNACINEHNGVLRLASSKDDMVQITLLNSKMDVIERLDNIAVNGNMVSARFIGGRGYLVSDSKTEPVFAVDLTDKPKQIGAIKLPAGTMAVRNLDAEHFVCVKEDGSIAMLNIADIDNQTEMFTVQTGGKCDTDNILLNADEGILAVPVEQYTAEQSTEATTTAVSEGSTEATTAEAVTQSGEAVLQGVNVYKVDVAGGAFVPVCTVSHITDDYDESRVIKAMLYKDDRIYTVSDADFKSNYVK